jgi:hypothetical protein
MYDHAVCLRGYDTSTSSVLYLDPNGGLGHGTTYSNFNNGFKWDGNASIWDDTIFDCQ